MYRGIRTPSLFERTELVMAEPIPPPIARAVKGIVLLVPMRAYHLGSILAQTFQLVLQQVSPTEQQQQSKPMERRRTFPRARSRLARPFCRLFPVTRFRVSSKDNESTHNSSQTSNTSHEAQEADENRPLLESLDMQLGFQTVDTP